MGFRFPLRFFSKSAVNRSEQVKLGKKIQKIEGLDEALTLYEKMRPSPSLEQFNLLLTRLVNLRKYSVAICIFRDMASSGVSLNDISLNTAINCYCLSNRVDYGFSIMGWFFKRGFVPDRFTFNAIFRGLFREKKIIEAEILFRKIVRERLCELDAATYCTMLDQLCKAGNTTDAIEVLRDMDSALKLFDEISEKNIKLYLITYTTLICALCHLNRWREVKILLGDMIFFKLLPDVVTFTTIIDCFCKEALIDEAADVFRIMIQRYVVSDVVIYNSLMDGYCQQGRIGEARSIFDFMARNNIAPNNHTLNISFALMGCDELQSIGPKPDFYTYCNLLSGLCRKEKAKQALSLLEGLEHQGENLYVAYYNIVVDGLFKSKEFEIALAVFHDLHIKGLKPNTATYNIMIRGFCQIGLLEKAKELILLMQQESVSLDGIIYNAIVQENLRRGEYEDAGKVLKEMGEKGFFPNWLTFELLNMLHRYVPSTPSHAIGQQTCMRMAMALRRKLGY